MGWVKDRQNTQKPKTEKKKKKQKKRAEHTIQSRTAPMCFPFRCYTRFTGWAGSENGSNIDVIFDSCFYEDLGLIWGTLWDTILVKNREKCVAKTGFREVVKMVRNKR